MPCVGTQASLRTQCQLKAWEVTFKAAGRMQPLRKSAQRHPSQVVTVSESAAK